jgi:long-chain acyl-CoA synthetase
MESTSIIAAPTIAAVAPETVTSLLAESAAAHGARTALVGGDERVTYAELEARAEAAAGALAAQGVRRGDRVGIRLPNSPAWVAAYYGILRLGAVAVPLNVLLRDREVAERVADAGAKVVVDRELPRRGPAPPAAEADAGEVAVLLYTSGTTGRPKGAELTHHGLATVARTLGGLLGVGPEDVVLGAAPLAHVFGMSAALNMTLAAGASVALMERFEPAPALELVERERVSVFLGVPTMCLGLLAAPRAGGDMPRIRVAHCGGAPLPAATLAEFADRFECTVLEGYGLTETAGTVTTHRAGRPVKPGTVGEPIPGLELRLDGDGEVLVRGAGVMRGYWRNASETAAALSADGWLATGDIGSVDEDGYLTLVDRKKDVILRGGYSVYPREVEEALHEHPAVAQAAVVGVPHPELGEEVAALVVARAPVGADDLRGFARERLAGYKYPRLVVLVDELPVGPTGKVLRRAIDRAALAELL